jgi:hypothetical protein
MLDREAPTPGPATETPAPAPAPAPEPAAHEPSAREDLYSETEEPEPSPEPQPGAEPGAAAPKPEEPADENTISTVDELLEHYQLDPEAFNGLKVNVKVDRQTTAVPISELIKSYQIGEAATKRLEDAKTKAASIISDVTTKQEQLHAELSSAATLIGEAEAMFEADSKAIDWNKLRREDPAEYAAQKRDFDDRAARIKDLKAKGAKAWRDAVASQRTEAETQTAARIAAEKDNLLAAIPDWKDQEKAKVEVGKLTSYLTGLPETLAFSPDEIRATTDHRLLVLARKAMLYDASQNKTSAALKRVAKVPKTIKPAAGRTAAPAAPASKSAGILKDLYG